MVESVWDLENADALQDLEGNIVMKVTELTPLMITVVEKSML